jgi:hypothetical protein
MSLSDNNTIKTMLSDREISLVLQKFPKFELSYENITHKKVHNANVILAIPEGNHFFTWFTSYNNENKCFALEIDDNNKIKSIKKINTSFMDCLCLALGTIFYGTMFKYNDISCFSIEDIYYYKGQNYIYTPYSNKLQLLKAIFTNEISQSLLNNRFTVFGMPLIYSDFNLLLTDIQKLPYKISQLKFRFFEKNNARKIMTMNYYNQIDKKTEQIDKKTEQIDKKTEKIDKKPEQIDKKTEQIDKKTLIKKTVQRDTYQRDKNKKTAIFKIMAGTEPDIYNLFITKNGNEEYYDIAIIPDYKTSVMMNSLFRNIKENINLDAIEESDDETDFEDGREDKYTYLDRSFNIKCEFNYKFKRWVPISLVG